MNDEEMINMLKRYIEDKGINAAELARRLETSAANVSHWFSGRMTRALSPRNKAKIRALLGSQWQRATAIAVNGSAASVMGDATVGMGLLDSAASAIMASDMCAECKVKAYQIIADIKQANGNQP